jgi:hypothetical protein
MNLSVARYPGSSIALRAIIFAGLLIFLGGLAALYGSFPTAAFCAESEPAPASGQSTSTSIIWSELLQKTPFPHTAPLPARVRTALDGTYTKLDPKKAPPVPCRRCPDYVPQGGIWKLNLDKGIFRIFHESTGWRSIGSTCRLWKTNVPSGSVQKILQNFPGCHVNRLRWKPVSVVTGTNPLAANKGIAVDIK